MVFSVELPIKCNWNKFKLIDVESWERPRIGGKKSVNAFKDGSIILLDMIKLFFTKMFKEIYLLKNENTNIFFPILLISLLPAIILSGSAIINISIIIIGTLFLINLIKYNNFNQINLNYFIYLSLFFFSLLINIFTSEFGLNDFTRQVGFLRYMLFVFAVLFFQL